MQFDYNVFPSKFKYLNYKDKFNFSINSSYKQIINF